METSSCSRIALGTVQFGLDYGIANTAGKVTIDKARDILKLAKHQGITTLDTAAAYGDSEAVLGQIAPNDFQIITKLPSKPESEFPENWVSEQLGLSLNRLNSRKLHGLLLHDISVLSTEFGATVYNGMLKAKDENLVRKIGWSIYQPRDLAEIPDHMVPDIVQIPFNIFDNRMIGSDRLKQLKQRGCEIHARSVFLQGLLLMNNQDRPIWADQWPDIWKIWDDFLSINRLSAHEVCLNHVLANPDIDKAVIGVDNIDQLKQVLAASDMGDTLTPPNLGEVPIELIDPRKWTAY